MTLSDARNLSLAHKPTHLISLTIRPWFINLKSLIWMHTYTLTKTFIRFIQVYNLCLGCPKTLTCYSIVSKYNDPEKKVKDQVSCYPSSSSVNNHRLNLLLPWHQFHYVFLSEMERKRNIFRKSYLNILNIMYFLRLTFSKCNSSLTR
jgi:hypothetical protein